MFSTVPSMASDDGFRVENKIFANDDEAPTSQSVTIFYEDLVYDYLENPREITVFDRPRGRFILLDPLRRIRTELTTGELKLLADRLQQWAAQQPDEFLRFSAQPDLAENFDAATGELRMESPWISYQVETSPAKDETILQEYVEFCDWYCLLNARINPGSRPPFARLQVNEALERLDRLPTEVHLTIRPKGERLFREEVSARSEHHVIYQLLEGDRQLVAQTDQFMVMFQPISFRQYQSRIQPNDR